MQPQIQLHLDIYTSVIHCYLLFFNYSFHRRNCFLTNFNVHWMAIYAARQMVCDIIPVTVSSLSELAVLYEYLGNKARGKDH